MLFTFYGPPLLLGHVALFWAVLYPSEGVRQTGVSLYWSQLVEHFKMRY
jgi:hypothetical protein